MLTIYIHFISYDSAFVSMNIKSWFEQVRGQSLSEKEKTLLFSTIQDKIHAQSVSIMGRFAYYRNVFALSILIVAVGAYYQWHALSNNTVQQQEPIQVTTVSPFWWVQADTVWKVIFVEWEMWVFVDNQLIETLDIVSWWVVHLQENARLELLVRHGTKAIITWPAQFSIERLIDTEWKSTLLINLIRWSYFELLPVLAQEQAMYDFDEWVWYHDEVILVKTQEFEITKNTLNDDFHLTITQDDWWAATLINQGADLLVKHINSENEITLHHNNQLSFDNLTAQEAVELFDDIAHNQLTISYTIDDKISTVFTPSWSVSQNPDAEIAVNNKKSQIDDQAIDKQEELLTANQQDDKRVLDPATSELLLAYFTDPKIPSYIQEENVWAITIILNNARNLLWLESLAWDPVTLADDIAWFKTYLFDKYFVTPSLLSSIDTLYTQLIKNTQ